MSEALVRRLLWEVRVLRVLVIAIGLGGAGLLAQDLPLNDSPIITRELTVARGDDSESLRLSAERRATLELRDTQGRVRVRLGLNPNGRPSLTTYDERGRATEYFGPSFGVRPLTND